MTRTLQVEADLMNGPIDSTASHHRTLRAARPANSATRGHQVVIERHAIAAGQSGLVHDEATSRNAQRIPESGNRSDRCSPPSSREQVPAASKAAVWFQGANVCAR